ncbi:polysaccharide ABC transporter ATP-binding protein [Mesonia sp.]|uniref:ABC transporter ATP-binding protein n=1 Tax=Mesonia sp. TaxID=1960830 RepID=UPI0017788BFA|nr:polysaccharide ABC transporter ATP-binding protein [Mesonia sp.]HIB35967.1 ATP-binding cassette domain-containing protein [Mesonia sp.]
MDNIILKAENISKQYRLGVVGTGTLSHDINRFWHKIRGKGDPYAKVGSVNDRSTEASEEYVWALKDINFNVRKGEVLGIIGKNGAGKSTLLKLLSRVTGPTTGSIKTKGRIASLLEVGTGFHPELTGKENIYLNGAILGMSKKEVEDKFDEIVDFSGCKKYVNTPVKRYSSGMRVRLAFAVAAHLEPEILVIDEVLAVGDAEFQKKAIGKMQDISKGEGRTVLFVSHDMGAIQNLCTRLLVLENGGVCFEGNVSEGVEYYLQNNKAKELNYKNAAVTEGISSVKFLNSDFQEIGMVLTGQKVIVQVDYNNPEQKDLSLSIGFFDGLSNFLFSCRSDIVNLTMNSRKGKAYLEIHKWPLSPGFYHYNLAVHFKSTMVENIKEAGTVETEKGDFYGTGKLPGKKKAFYIDYNWSEDVL